MQRGCNLVVSGYCLYSAATHIVLTTGAGLHMFTLDDVSGEFYLTRCNIYSFNTAARTWYRGSGTLLERDLEQNKVAGLDPNLKSTGPLHMKSRG